MLSDLRFASRLLRRSPGLTLTATLSTAVGVAATTAIFSVMSALLLRPLPAGEPDRLVRLGLTARGEAAFRAFSYPEFLHFLHSSRTLSDVAGHQPQPITLAGPAGPFDSARNGPAAQGRPEIIWAEIVTGTYFTALRVAPSPGRGFLPEDDRVPGARPVVVISHRVWSRRFGSDPEIVGRLVRINGREFTVVGVAPPQFAGTFPGFAIDLWAPAMMTAALVTDGTDVERREDRYLMLVGRMQPNATIASVQAEMSALAAALAAQFPDTNKDLDVAVKPATGVHPAIAPMVATFLWLLMGVVSLVLLIACTNVANLLLARAAVRRREIAVRRAIGAGTGALVRQWLAESLLLALAGGGLGLAMTGGVVQVLNRFTAPTGVPVALGLSVDGRVLLFALAAAVGSGVVFGLAPVLHVLKVDVLAGLRDEGLLSRGVRGRRVLVIAQVAVSVLLLISAGLLTRSISRSEIMDPGFDPDGVLVMSFDPAMLGYDAARSLLFYEELLNQSRALPGVRAAALAAFPPLGDRGDDVGVVLLDPGGDRQPRRTGYNAISPGLLQALDIPLLRGRDFTEHDRRGSRGVAMVNESFARAMWPGQSAVGQQMRLRDESAPREIVGVARDAKYRGFGDSERPFIYLPVAQYGRFDLTLHVRIDGETSAILPALREIARRIAPDVPAHDVRPLRETMAFALVPARVTRQVLAVATGIVLFLAVIGLYGLVSYLVTERRRELGIRMALGAAPRDVLWRVVRQGLGLALPGVAVGVGAALAVTRVLQSFLYGVSATDPMVFTTGAAVLIAVALVAAYLPARRAAMLDPVTVLRRD